MPVEEVKVLGDSEMETGRSLAIGLGIVLVSSLVILGLFLAAVVPDLLMYAVPGGVTIVSALVTGVLFWAYRRRNQIIAYYLVRPTNPPAPEPAPPAPSLPEPKIDAKEVSRGGELHGFPSSTLMWVCDYLAGKNSWAESRMEGLPVPHLFPTEKFGKADKSTPYNRMFNSEFGLFIRAGIITGRGGAGNDTGKLVIASPITMMQMLKELPEGD